MKIISSPLELKEYLTTIKKNLPQTVGFVPTMGALHEGHITLIKRARAENEIVVVSIFVNPTQFLAGEDLDKYPRRDEADKKICELSGVDILFFPHAKDMYGEDEVSLLAPKVRGYVLEGTSRPGHFNGVLTVVMKLLHLVNPHRAYFGKKDAQQLNLIQLMVQQMFMDCKRRSRRYGERKRRIGTKQSQCVSYPKRAPRSFKNIRFVVSSRQNGKQKYPCNKRDSTCHERDAQALGDIVRSDRKSSF